MFMIGSRVAAHGVHQAGLMAPCCDDRCDDSCDDRCGGKTRRVSTGGVDTTFAFESDSQSSIHSGIGLHCGSGRESELLRTAHVRLLHARVAIIKNSDNNNCNCQFQRRFHIFQTSESLPRNFTWIKCQGVAHVS